MGDHQRAAYQSGKAGINALTRHVASHWGKQGIRCNCVSTGGVMTESAEKMALTLRQLQNVTDRRLGQTFSPEWWAVTRRADRRLCPFPRGVSPRKTCT
ncbi:SDR family oxidoreductase [Streptomyces doebereineriae]|uniref:SDR family oxidoreductase n=1 Tax=Streptomyces doebereineriae TaxID=3075528 RepID=UPI00374E0127